MPKISLNEKETKLLHKIIDLANETTFSPGIKEWLYQYHGDCTIQFNEFIGSMTRSEIDEFMVKIGMQGIRDAKAMEVKEEIQLQVIPHLKRIVASNGTEVWRSNLHYQVDVLLDVIQDNGFNVRDNFRTNGWHWDWWVDIKKDGTTYTLSGSGFCGGLKFYLAEEEE